MAALVPGVIFALTIGWTAFIAWLEVSSGEHAGFPNIANAVVRGTAPAAPLIPIYALLADIDSGFNGRSPQW